MSEDKNAEIKKTFQEHGVAVFITPSQTGKLIDPCDNPYFSGFKAKLRQRDTSTRELKKAAVFDVARGSSGLEVRNAWRKSGWKIPFEPYEYPRHLPPTTE